MEKPREIAVRVLLQHSRGGNWLEAVLEQELLRSPLSPLDRALAQELVFGVVRWRATLDWLIARKTGGRTQRELLQILLRLGLYQAFWLDRIPDHALTHETVELARTLGCGPQSGFINAVLRGYLRERTETRQALDELKQREPALGWSHPDWLVARWQARFGSEHLAHLMAWNNTPAPVYVRTNTLRTTPEMLARQFEAESVSFVQRDFPWAPPGLLFELRGHPPLTALASFNNGFFYVQDPSTLLAVTLLDPRPGETVLDLCAAPGGKSTLIAQLMRDEGTTLAEDIDPTRLTRVVENCARLGVRSVRPAVTGAPRVEPPSASGLFDRILVDAPCSNTGVMRRRVDLRWRLQASELERLPAMQLELLRQARPRLKPGGLLVYSTCSLEPEENRAVVDRFLAESPEFQRVAEQAVDPVEGAVDGAYAAALRHGGTG